MLFQWGALQFDITPFNVHEADQMTATDWARKEIAGAAIYREWVGEGDEEITLRGRVFPIASAASPNSRFWKVFAVRAKPSK